MRILSGIQPTGQIHIGNYLGAVKQWVELQKDNDCIFIIVDLHAITIPYEAHSLKERILNTAADLIAVGIDYQKHILFVQSDVAEHTELTWLLSSVASFGDLSRMTQFKDKAKKQKDFVSAGLFYYPVLMAADILLYNIDVVPVGEDQLQHVELTRSIAERFNSRFGQFFKLPKALLGDESLSRIKSLTDPNQKMSKSENKGCIFLSDKPDVIRQKIREAVTDSGKEIKYDPQKKAAISNLMAIYKGFSLKSFEEIEKEFAGKNYLKFKEELAELIIRSLTPIQERRKELVSNPQELLKILRDGSLRAKEIASQNIIEIKKKMGIWR